MVPGASSPGCVRGAGGLDVLPKARSRGGRRSPRPSLFVAFVYRPAPVGPPTTTNAHTILFSGRDIWRNGVFAYGGLLVAPGGFEQDGFMLKLLLSGGALPLQRRQPRRRRGRSAPNGMTQALPGFRIKRGNAEIKFFFGPEWQRIGCGRTIRATACAAQASACAWPANSGTSRRRDTLIAGDASLSTIATSHSARLAFGWRVADDIFNGDGFYVGPEVQYFGSDGYRQWRVGAHITSLKTEATEWSAAVGWAQRHRRPRQPLCAAELASNCLIVRNRFTSDHTNPACAGTASPRWSSRSASAPPSPPRRNAGRRPTRLSA